jgi:hypothetical protein
MITTRLVDGASSLGRLVLQNAGSTTMFQLKEVLKQAGWTHRASGTGASGTFSTTSGNANDQITNEGTGAGGLNRNNSWFVLESPDTIREVMFHRSTSDNSWRGYYSARDTFVGTGFGAISATVPPSATDQQQFLGTAGGFTTVCPATAAGGFVNTVAFDDAISGVYGWYHVHFAAGTVTPVGFMAMEPLAPGSFDAADDDPVVVIAAAGMATSDFYTTPAGSNGFRGWHRRGLAGSAFDRFGANIVSVATSQATLYGGTAGVGTDPWDQGETMRQIMVGRRSSWTTSIGVKGYLARMKWIGATSYRAYPTRYFPAGPQAYVVAGVLALPWPSNVIPELE